MTNDNVITNSESGKRVSVLGAARSGTAAAVLLARAGASVFVSDSAQIRGEPRDRLADEGLDFEENGHTDRVFAADYIVLSPGVSSSAAVVREARAKGITLYSEIEVASRFCKAPVLAVTGSNGKTTTTSLLGAILRASGATTHVAGNIGIPFSSVARQAGPDHVVVLEVSSFQLDHIDSFHPAVSVLLNITPDHMDRYGHDLAAYENSKFRICRNQTPADAFVFNLDDEAVRRGVSTRDWTNGPERFGFSLADHHAAAGFIRNNTLILRKGEKEEVLMQSNELALRGRHNAGNSLAAAIAARVMEVRSEVVRSSLSSFEGVPHRLEFIREVDGIEYVNDSKATNVNAVWFALESMNRPIVLIAGGRDKGNDYGPLEPLVEDRVRILIAIGEGADRLESALKAHVEQVVRVESMADAVRYASLLGRPGETVLLSPACASFDMFDDFEERGDIFRQLVSDL